MNENARLLIEFIKNYYVDGAVSRSHGHLLVAIQLWPKRNCDQLTNDQTNDDIHPCQVCYISSRSPIRQNKPLLVHLTTDVGEHVILHAACVYLII